VGTVYELALQQNGKYSPSVLYSFQGDSHGANPTSSVIMDESGNLYGLAQGSEGFSAGVVFEVTP
jgi:hypothetical protein